MLVYSPFKILCLFPQLFFILFQSAIINTQPNLIAGHDLDFYQAYNKSADSSTTDPSIEDTPETIHNSSDKIYGVRWALSDYFSFNNIYIGSQAKKSLINHNYYTLSFNSPLELNGEIFVKIQDMKYSCSKKFLNVPKTYDHQVVTVQPNQHLSNSTYFWIHVCYVTNKLDGLVSQTEDPFMEWKYSIVQQQNIFAYKIDQKSRRIERKKEILFSSVFRTPNPNPNPNKNKKEGGKVKENIMVIGDWGFISQQKQREKGWFPILDSLIQQIQTDKTLMMIIFVGDMGYDMQGDRYSIFLKYIEPITSRLAFMTSPGNHDYYYHKDTFQLLAETFLSPSSTQFFNYYYSFVLGDSIFISYSPLKEVFQAPEVQVSVFQMFQKDFANLFAGDPRQAALAKISKQFHLFVFSHYPIFCSKIQGLGTCQQNKYRLKQYMEFFRHLQMDMYIAGHLHYYERTSQICWAQGDSKFSIVDNYSYFEENNHKYQIYSEKCPIYVVEGAAGNNYFLEEDGAITPTQVSKKIVYRTGFGIFTIVSDYFPDTFSPIANQIKYSHYQIVERGKASVTDKVMKYLPTKKTMENDKADNLLIKVYIIQAILILSVIFLFLYGKGRVHTLEKRQAKKYSEHIEMIEEKYEATSNIKPSQSHENRKSQQYQR